MLLKMSGRSCPLICFLTTALIQIDVSQWIGERLMKGKFICKAFFALILLFCLNAAFAKPGLTLKEKRILSHASKIRINGWTHVSIKGTPYDRGFQYGYLVSKEFAAAYKVTAAMTYKTMGVKMSTFNKVALRVSKGKIPKELMQEMQGIADGLTKAGVPMSLDQIIGWNDLTEISGYWWPAIGNKHYLKYVPKGLINYSQYPSPYSSRHKKIHKNVKAFGPIPNNVRNKYTCSGFIATGSATKDGKIVIGHETFDDFYAGEFENIILDITPSKGERMIFQTTPGLIQSNTDFWITGAGLVIVETTLANQYAYVDGKTPEFVRVRIASQYAKTIPQWVRMMEKGNNGGYANTWLIGNINNNRIASFSQALHYQGFREKSDGYFTGANVSQDPRIRNVGAVGSGYNDTRQQTGARRTRWISLIAENYGKIDRKVGEKMLADTYDVYLNKPNNPSSRTICAEYDIDPQPFVSNPAAVWNIPYYPAGSIDGKVTTAAAAKKMMMWARFGRANGKAFNAKAFMQKHPEWRWEKDYLFSRPSEPWTEFAM
jgi:hypothetical protein